MATAPSFASVVARGAVLLGNAETDTLNPTQASVVLTAGTNGTKIEEIVVTAALTGSLVPTTVAGLVYLFIYDGTVSRLFDTVAITAVTPSTTTAPFRSTPVRYPNLWLKSGESLRASQSIAGNASRLIVNCFGADL